MGKGNFIWVNISTSYPPVFFWPLRRLEELVEILAQINKPFAVVSALQSFWFIASHDIGSRRNPQLLDKYGFVYVSLLRSTLAWKGNDSLGGYLFGVNSFFFLSCVFTIFTSVHKPGRVSLLMRKSDTSTNKRFKYFLTMSFHGFKAEHMV